MDNYDNESVTCTGVNNVTAGSKHALSETRALQQGRLQFGSMHSKTAMTGDEVMHSEEWGDGRTAMGRLGIAQTAKSRFPALRARRKVHHCNRACRSRVCLCDHSRRCNSTINWITAQRSIVFRDRRTPTTTKQHTLCLDSSGNTSGGLFAISIVSLDIDRNFEILTKFPIKL